MSRPLVRVALCLLVAALIGTQSHWSLLALAAGACFVPARRWFAAWWPLAVGMLVGVVVVASSSGHLGRWPSIVLVVALVGTTALRSAPRWEKSVPTGIAVAALVVVAAGVTILLLRPPGVTGPADPPSQGQTLRVVRSGAQLAHVHQRGRRPDHRPCVGPARRSLPRPDARYLSDGVGRRRDHRRLASGRGREHDGLGLSSARRAHVVCGGGGRGLRRGRGHQPGVGSAGHRHPRRERGGAGHAGSRCERVAWRLARDQAGSGCDGVGFGRGRARRASRPRSGSPAMPAADWSSPRATRRLRPRRLRHLLVTSSAGPM